MPYDSHETPADFYETSMHEHRSAAPPHRKENHQKQMKRLKSFAMFWASFSIFLVAAPKAGARPGSTRTSNTVQSSPVPSQDKNPAGVTDSSDYVGAETCKSCHEDIYNNWEKSPHWKTTLDTKGGPSRQGCE